MIFEFLSDYSCWLCVANDLSRIKYSRNANIVYFFCEGSAVEDYHADFGFSSSSFVYGGSFFRAGTTQ